jgi:hypothetical protein
MSHPEPQRTDVRIERYDKDQTEWARRFLGLPPDVTLQSADFAAAGVRPYSVTGEEDCNAVVGTGWAALLGGITGSPVAAPLSATNGRIGVGTSTVVTSWGDMWLHGDTGSASTTSYYQLCGTAPVIATATGPCSLTLNASFGGSVANFAWNEFGVDNGAASGVYLNGLAGGYILFSRGVFSPSEGTKILGQTWPFAATMTWGFASGDAILSDVGP